MYLSKFKSLPQICSFSTMGSFKIKNKWHSYIQDKVHQGEKFRICCWLFRVLLSPRGWRKFYTAVSAVDSICSLPPLLELAPFYTCYSILEYSPMVHPLFNMLGFILWLDCILTSRLSWALMAPRLSCFP